MRYLTPPTAPPLSPPSAADRTVMTTPAAVLFDLDGTLVDTATDFHAAASTTLADLKLPPVSLAETRSYVGDGMPRFIKRLLTRQWWGEPDEALFERANERMLENYENENTARLQVYEGVADTLRALRQKAVKMACVTNKSTRFTLPLLDACGLDVYFDDTICGDTLEVKKPHPAPLLHACDSLGAAAADTVMVGDSITDQKAAVAAGCRFIVVSYGYHGEGPLPAADAVVDRFSDLQEAFSLTNRC